MSKTEDPCFTLFQPPSGFALAETGPYDRVHATRKPIFLAEEPERQDDALKQAPICPINNTI